MKSNERKRLEDVAQFDSRVCAMLKTIDAGCGETGAFVRTIEDLAHAYKLAIDRAVFLEMRARPEPMRLGSCPLTSRGSDMEGIEKTFRLFAVVFFLLGLAVGWAVFY